MKMKKNKAISTILGALIFLQILLISMVLVIYVVNNETNVTLKGVQRVQALSEYAPITEDVENNVTYLYSTSPFTITHVIYPDGEIVNTTIEVKNRVPIPQILNGSQWAVIITSQGTWYNVTLLGGSDSQGIITFPNYHDFGMPLDPSVLNITPNYVAYYYYYGHGDPTFNEYWTQPHWDVLNGVANPSALSLVPVNVTIGDPTTYNYALTDAVLVTKPLSPEGWINITLYQPINYNPDYVLPCAYPFILPYTPPTLLGNWLIGGTTYSLEDINLPVGIYIPTNVTATFALNTTSGQIFTTNIPSLQYSYIYVDNWEVTNVKINGYNYGFTWFTPQIGTTTTSLSPDIIPFHKPSYFPGYPINSPLRNPIFTATAFTPDISYIGMPPLNWYNISGANDWFYTPLGKELPSGPLEWPVAPQYANESNIPNLKVLNLQNFPVTVYQVDINLHKGEVLDYGYSSFNNSWFLIYNYTFNYNNPQLYLKTVSDLNGWYSFGYAIPNGNGGYNLVGSLPPSYKGQSYFGDIFLYNIADIEYLTNYPIYIAIPQGAYLLQVNLS